MKKYRSHPINILENTSKFLILLLIPILRTLIVVLISFGEGFVTWFKGAWLDLAIVLLIIALSIYNWYLYQFSFDDTGIYINKGILLTNTKFIPIKNICSLSIQKPWYYKPFKIIRLTADTDGGTFTSSDFHITVKETYAINLSNAIKKRLYSDTKIKKYYIPHSFYLAVFSFLTSNSITGALYLSASISQIGNFFGKDIQNKLFMGFQKLSNILAFGFPPIAVIIAYIILGTWVVSFLTNLLHNLRFCVLRKGKYLEISSSFLSSYFSLIAIDRINSVITRQSLLTKIFRLSSILIDCTGYGKRRGEIEVLFPCGINTDLKSNLQVLLPEIEFIKKQTKPKFINLSRFLIPPITLILSIVGLFLVALHYLPDFKKTIWLLFIISIIPCLWWLLIKIYSFFFSGIGANDKIFTIYYTFGYQILSVSIPRDKISKIEFSQTMFQLSTKCCDVTFHTCGEGMKKYKVLNLNLPEVKKVLNLTNNELKLTTKKGFTFWKD